MSHEQSTTWGASRVKGPAPFLQTHWLCGHHTSPSPLLFHHGLWDGGGPGQKASVEPCVAGGGRWGAPTPACHNPALGAHTTATGKASLSLIPPPDPGFLKPSEGPGHRLALLYQTFPGHPSKLDSYSWLSRGPPEAAFVPRWGHNP